MTDMRIITTSADAPPLDGDGDHTWRDPDTGRVLAYVDPRDKQVTMINAPAISSGVWQEIAAFTADAAVIDLAQLPATRVEPGCHVGVAVSVDGGSMQVFEDEGAIVRTLARALAAWEEMVAAPARAPRVPADPRVAALTGAGFTPTDTARIIDRLDRLAAAQEA